MHITFTQLVRSKTRFGVPAWQPSTNRACCEFHSFWYSHLASGLVSPRITGIPNALALWRHNFQFPAIDFRLPLVAQFGSHVIHSFLHKVPRRHRTSAPQIIGKPDLFSELIIWHPAFHLSPSTIALKRSNILSSSLRTRGWFGDPRKLQI